MTIEDKIHELVAPLLADLDVELVDLSYAGGRLKVTVDTDEGIGSALLTRATRMISRELDERDPISGTYTLEVSSPGLERPLKRPEQWIRAIGDDVSAKLVPSDDLPRRIKGFLKSADEDGFVIVDGDGTEHAHGYHVISKAKTVFEWGPGAKPGQSKSNQRKASAQ